MGEESLLEDMRAAVQGDFERAQQRRGREVPAEPEPAVPEARVAEPDPMAEPDAPEEHPPTSFLSRLFRYSAR